MMEDALATRNRSFSRKGLELTHPNAAGIDIGSASHFVAVPADRDDEPVREFASFTADLHRLADWLRDCGVDTVAMESTGVYWIPLFELLDARGFTVLLVNARHVKNVSGRKSDVLDCQWLQQLMSYGLLRGAFRPDDQVCVLRALARQRSTLLKTQARSVQHMQKALVQMNIQLANVIADVAGASGQAILRAIVAGERNPYVLAGLKNSRVRASDEGSLAACKAPGAPSTCSRCARRWTRSTSAANSCSNATRRSRRSFSGCTSPTSSRTRARSAARPATRRSSTCARGCSRCAAWTSRASTASM